jgi:hypothetical protein
MQNLRSWIVMLVAGCGRVAFDDARMARDSGVDATACAAVFCDGFEDPALGAWQAMADGTAMTSRDPMFGYRGAGLRVTAPIGSSRAVRYVDVFTAPPADLWTRVWVYLPSTTELDLEVVAVSEPTTTANIVFSIYEDAIDIHAHAIASNFEVSAMTPPPRDRWVCYELHVAVAAAGRVALYGDGVALLDQSAVDTRGITGRVLLGAFSKPGSASEEIFVDEVAIGIVRPGC